MDYILTKKAMLRLGKLLVSRYKDKMDIDDTVATGKLKDSFKYKMTGFDTNILSVEVLAAKYAKIVDEGRKAGKRNPGIRPIIEWMKAKGIKPYKGTKASDYKQAAASISKFIGEKGSIKRFGFKGSNFIDIVAKQYAYPEIQNILESYEKDLENIINERVKAE